MLCIVQLTFCNVVNIDEQLVYAPHPTDANRSHYTFAYYEYEWQLTNTFAYYEYEWLLSELSLDLGTLADAIV